MINSLKDLMEQGFRYENLCHLIPIVIIYCAGTCHCERSEAKQSLAFEWVEIATALQASQ